MQMRILLLGVLLTVSVGVREIGTLSAPVNACFFQMDNKAECDRKLYTAEFATTSGHTNKCQVLEIAGHAQCNLRKAEEDCTIGNISFEYDEFDFCVIE